MSDRDTSIVGTLVAILFGPLLWAAHLLVVYGSHASLCAAGDRLPLLGAEHLPLILWGATGIGVALAVANAVFPASLHRLLRAGGQDRSFTTRAARVLSGLSAIAIFYGGVAIATVPLCVVAR